MHPLINDGSGTYEMADLNAYIDKITDKGCIITITEKGELQAFLAGYANDYESKTGFLSMTVVSPLVRRMGYGRRLMEFFLTDLVHKGFERCLTEVKENNTPAINTCRRAGFHELDRKGSYIILEKRLK
ncbi:Acetyltransferase (GNAT) family protein [Mucilaginibacter xinganensis]|uniref:Acetyltransferase (GNAT) family protein n=2 Tax=Mucilaginibacter xinganensis TaxID=1234841 RepID=A0A223NUS8_9SPHI|nr:Acetyltransferase (GNAT) family protein [Mucilaginibacter xinganensis]